MDEKTILHHIDDLVAEEKTLRSDRDGLNDCNRARLGHIEAQLDQAWDLLRQRRARAEMGKSPGQASERTVTEVENYLQ